MSVSNSDRRRKLRRNRKWLIAVRGFAILILGVGAIILSLRLVWNGTGICAALMLVNILILYTALRRAKVLDRSYAARD